MAKDYTRFTDAELIREITAMVQDYRDVNFRRISIQAVVSYNALLPTSLTDAQFSSAVVNLAGLLTVPVPSTPADLTALTSAELLALAQQHELTAWDYQARVEQLNQVEAFYRKLGFAAGTTAPNAIAAIRASFVTFANYARGTRQGLPTLT